MKQKKVGDSAGDIVTYAKFIKTLYLPVSTLGVKRVSWDERWPRNSRLILDVG
jgi:hypothetical protein